MATFKCQKPGSCPLSKNGKTTQNKNLKIKKLQIHQSGQVKSCCKAQVFPETPSFQVKVNKVRTYAPEKKVYKIGLTYYL